MSAKILILLAVSIPCLLVVSVIVAAPGNPTATYSIEWWTVDGGGGSSSFGGFGGGHSGGGEASRGW